MRKRSYACCFTLEQSKSLLYEYTKINVNDKKSIGICLEFDGINLENYLSEIFRKLLFAVCENQVQNIFHLNFGLIKYGDIKADLFCKKFLRNPVFYLYLKDMVFKNEKEYRVSLFSIGINWKEILGLDLEIEFPNYIHMPFDFNHAIKKNIITRTYITTHPDQKEDAKNKISNLLQSKPFTDIKFL